MGGVPRHSACDHAFRCRQPVSSACWRLRRCLTPLFYSATAPGLIVPIDGHRRSLRYSATKSCQYTLAPINARIMVRTHALNPTRAGHCKSGYTRKLSSLTRHLSIASVAGARPASAASGVDAGSAVLFMKSELTVVPALPGSRRARRRPPAGRCCGRRSHFLTSRGRWRLGRSPFVPRWLAAVAAWRCSCCAALQQPRRGRAGGAS